MLGLAILYVANATAGAEPHSWETVPAAPFWLQCVAVVAGFIAFVLLMRKAAREGKLEDIATPSGAGGRGDPLGAPATCGGGSETRNPRKELDT